MYKNKRDSVEQQKFSNTKTKEFKKKLKPWKQGFAKNRRNSIEKK